MSDISFYSNTTYQALPNRKNPRVELAIDGKNIKLISFDLYQPFSLKAKLLKKLGYSLPFLNRFKAKKSEFILFVEKRLQREIITSIYHATDNDKVVLQLQSGSKLLGYMKVGMTPRGNQRINNEIGALDLLKHLDTPDILDSGEYLGHQFLFITAIKGQHIELSLESIHEILNELRKHAIKSKMLLKDHPRIITIREWLIGYGKFELVDVLENIDLEIQAEVVYEHGDMAPWNIVKSDGKLSLIDFEYFVEDGIQEFDLIKYYYQIGSLLKGLRKRKLACFVESNSKIQKFNIFFVLYLLKEICVKLKEEKCIDEELNMLKFLKVLK